MPGWSPRRPMPHGANGEFHLERHRAPQILEGIASMGATTQGELVRMVVVPLLVFLPQWRWYTGAGTWWQRSHPCMPWCSMDGSSCATAPRRTSRYGGSVRPVGGEGVHPLRIRYVCLKCLQEIVICCIPGVKSQVRGARPGIVP
jgi:hypothetical protein